jgi:tetratricopeptide (TPR) repeat protein
MQDSNRRLLRARGLALLALLALLSGGCGDEKGGTGPGADAGTGPAGAGGATDADVLRARAEAFHVDTKYGDAASAIAPLVERPDAAAEDLVRAGIIALAAGRLDVAVGYADRALALAPLDPAANFLRGNLHLAVQEHPEAEARFRAVLAADPADNAARIQLAETLFNVEREEEAEALWREVQAVGPEANPALYAVAIFRLSRSLIFAGRTDEGMALKDEHTRLGPQDIDASTLGYGRLLPPTPRARPAEPAIPHWPAFAAGASADLHGATHLLLRDLDRDGRTDLVGWGGHGLAVALQKTAGAFEVQRVHERAVLSLAAGDLGTGDAGDPLAAEEPRRAFHSPALELLTVDAEPGATTGTVRLHALDGAGRFVAAVLEPALPAGVRNAILSDFDHDGDLDVVLATDGGLLVQRNDGVTDGAPVRLADASSEAGRALQDARAVLAEDFDGDNDVDWLVTTARGLALLSNDRRERFSDVSAAWGVPALAAVAALDLDEDGRADLVLSGADDALAWARNEPSAAPGAGGARFAAPAPLRAETGLLARAFADLDLDGHVDLVAARADGVSVGVAWPAGRTAPEAQALTALQGAGAGDGGGSVDGLAVADMDGDCDNDLVVLRDGRAQVLACSGPVGRALPLALDGQRDNDEGVGSIVELRSGALYRRLYWRGPELLGLGERGTAEVVRVSWPNGVLQHELDAPACVPVHMEQVLRLSGSCPFLYTWNGERFEFITDVLGTTPLGLPMDAERFVPFDHDEDVLVRGDQLAPRDGLLQLALTEELREVTYLDGVTLRAIDHPAGVEIQPDERFAFPPFPAPHVHTFRHVVPAARVTASDGSDVTAQLAAVDDDCARPFTRLPSQYDGLAEPWWLDIELARTPEERAALAAAPRIRLALTGWLQWGNASVNLAAAHHPDVEFVPPVLSVPDGEGWAPAGPPVGFPAGKTKTMVLDVTDIVRRDDPRLRLSTTLQLSWDAIRVVLDADDAPYADTPLPPAAALLHYRGFSWPQETGGGTRPETFDWNDHALPRWNQHPGRYTRYGSVLPLLLEADDRLAILGSGDCLRLHFDPSALPPLPEGWTRDWLLHLDGWAKDRDPNTAAAETVEPLPFHAMGSYPPAPGEEPADVAAHRAWQSEWNTREGAVLVPPLDLSRAAEVPRAAAALKPVR